MPTALVTGVTGYIGAHLALQLLQNGWHVKGAARDLSKANQLTAVLATKQSEINSKFECVIVEDMAVVGAYDTAAQGPSAPLLIELCLSAHADVDVVFHLASPVSIFSGSPVNEVYEPTVKGIASILHSAARSTSVRRFVLTSSVAAIQDIAKDGHYATEADWNETALQVYTQNLDNTPPVVAYMVRITLIRF